MIVGRQASEAGERKRGWSVKEQGAEQRWGGPAPLPEDPGGLACKQPACYPA